MDEATDKVQTGRVAAEEVDVKAKVIAENAPAKNFMGFIPANTFTEKE